MLNILQRTGQTPSARNYHAPDVYSERWRNPLVLFSFFFFNFIEVWLICNVVIISAVQQSDSVIHIHTFFF